LVNIHFLLINSTNCSTCLFSWYGLLIMVGVVGCVRWCRWLLQSDPPTTMCLTLTDPQAVWVTTRNATRTDNETSVSPIWTTDFTIKVGYGLAHGRGSK